MTEANKEIYEYYDWRLNRIDAAVLNIGQCIVDIHSTFLEVILMASSPEQVKAIGEKMDKLRQSTEKLLSDLQEGVDRYARK